MATPTFIDPGGDDDQDNLPEQQPPQAEPTPDQLDTVEQLPPAPDEQQDLDDTLKSLEDADTSITPEVEPPDTTEDRSDSPTEQVQDLQGLADKLESLPADDTPQPDADVAVAEDAAPEDIEPVNDLDQHLAEVQRLDEFGRAANAFNDANLGGGPPDAGGEDENSKGDFPSEDALRSLMDADVRNRSAMTDLLNAHERRLDELTERLERMRL